MSEYQLNEAGFEVLKDFLLNNLKRGDEVYQSPSALNAWATQAEDSIFHGQPQIEIRSSASLTGRPEILYFDIEKHFDKYENEGQAMRQFTAEEFYQFINSAGWEHHQRFETIDEYKEEEKTKVYGFAWVESEKDGVTIKVTEGWDYEKGDPASVDATGDGLDDAFVIEGAIIKDSNGDEMSLRAFWFDYDLPESFCTIDYESYLNQFRS